MPAKSGWPKSAKTVRNQVGSGVFPQSKKGKDIATEDQMKSVHPKAPLPVQKAQNGEPKMIDFIFGVTHTQHFHSLNMKLLAKLKLGGEIHDNSDGLTDFEAVRDVYGLQIEFPIYPNEGMDQRKAKVGRRRPPTGPVGQLWRDGQGHKICRFDDRFRLLLASLMVTLGKDLGKSAWKSFNNIESSGYPNPFTSSSPPLKPKDGQLVPVGKFSTTGFAPFSMANLTKMVREHRRYWRAVIAHGQPRRRSMECRSLYPFRTWYGSRPQQEVHRRVIGFCGRWEMNPGC
ncbi:mitochondrial matrix Mmp37-domain-containing protein [Apiospora sp. TS-2023a]